MTDQEADEEVIRRIGNLIRSRTTIKNERDSISLSAMDMHEELSKIRAAWESEHSMGGTEAPPAIECMLLALKRIRDLMHERDQAYSELAKRKTGEVQ